MKKYFLVAIVLLALWDQCFAQGNLNQDQFWTLTRVYGVIKYYNNEKDDSYLDKKVIGFFAKLEKPEYAIDDFNADLIGLFPPSLRSIKPNAKLINPFDQFEETDSKRTVNFLWIDEDKSLSELNKKLLWQLICFHKKVKNSNVKKEGTVIYKENEVPDSLSESDSYLLGLIKYWNVIEYLFPYKPLMDENWDRVYYRFIPEFQNIETDEEYLLTLKKLTAKLDDSHAFVDEPGRINDINVSKLPFSITIVQDQLVIESFNDSLSNLYGVKTGDVIELIDGKNFNDLWAEFSELNSYSTPQAGKSDLDLYLFHLFNYNDSTVSIRTNSDKTVHEEFIKTIKLQDFIELRSRIKEKVPFSVISDRIGYINYDDLSFSLLGKSIRKLKNKEYLILDCRGHNYGFTTLRLLNILGKIDKPFAKVYFPNNYYPGIFNKPKFIKHKILPKFRSTYKGKIIVLINKQPYSAMESVLMAIKIRRPDAVFIGTPTQGCDGQRYGVDLPGNRRVWFTGMGDWQYPDGSQFQRIGIQPDIFIEPMVESVRNGEDLILNRAFEYIDSLDKNLK